MSDADGATIESVLGESDVLPRSDRDAALAWARTLDHDIGRAVREAPHALWLGALADSLDQRLAWARFRNELDDRVAERAAALVELKNRSPDHPAEVRLRDLSERRRSDDPGVRSAALSELGDEADAFFRTDVGRALSMVASGSVLDESIETLRSVLSVDRMIAALAARPHTESPDERDERVIRETLADRQELIESDDAFGALSGGVAGRAMRWLSELGKARLRSATDELLVDARAARKTP